MRRFVKPALVLVVSLAFSQIVFSSTAHASIKPGYFTGAQDSNGSGDFVLPQDYSSSIVGGPAAIPDSVTSASSFYSFIVGKLGSSNIQERRGAGYIIQTMRGEPINSSGAHNMPSAADIADWKNKWIDNFPGFIQWNNSYDYSTPGNCLNTMNINAPGDGDPSDVAQYDDCGTELHTIKWIYKGEVLYAIKRRCANPVGRHITLPNWTLTGTSSVNNYSTSTYNASNPKPMDADDPSVTFRHSVRNNGPSDLADYTWYVEGKYNGSVWTRFQCSAGGINDQASPCSLPGGSESDVNSGSKAPSAVPITYRFPAGAANNDIYCQRIHYINANGPVSGEETSTASCVRFSTTPTIQDCDYQSGLAAPSGCSASCTVNSITGSGPNGIVVEGDRPIVNVTIRNTGTRDLPENVGGHKLAWANDSSPYFTEEGIPVGGVITRDFQLVTPASSPTVSVNGTVVYHQAYFLATAPCPGSATVYRHFNIDPHTSINMDNENPTVITYTTGGNKTEGPDIGVTQTSWLIYQNTGAKVNGDHVTNPVYGSPADESYNYSPPSIRAGDQYCSHVRIDPANGYVDSGGNVYPAGRNSVEVTSPTCPTVHNEPYFHVLNSDVSAGGGYGVNCTVTQAGINAYTKTTGSQPSGSGVQVGALSIRGNYGLNTAHLRTAAPVGSLGLAFSNTSNTTGGSSHSPALGGNLGSMGSNSCVPDYFATKSADLPADTANTVDVSTLNGKKYYEPNGGTLTLTSSSGIANGKGVVMYVKGNVVINSNIIFSGSANYGAPETIPSLYIITKGGDIYVDRNVSVLDGEYIAQPDGTVGGNIYSCANGITTYTGGGILGNCKTKQLIVNGSFVAQRVYLLRSFGSVRDSTPAELLGNPAKTCSDSGVTTLGDCAAEIFNFSPESYLAQPPFPPSSGPTTGKYKYFTSLAPVL